MKNGWEIRRFGDVCEFEKESREWKDLPYVGLEDIESNSGRFLGTKSPVTVKSMTFRFTSDHVLYGRLRPYLNKVLLPDFEGHCSTEIFPIRTSNELDRRYLFHWLRSDEIVAKINATWTGARMPRANMNQVLDFPIPVPPIDEQRRIIAVLDEVFACIDKAKANTEKNIQNARELFDSYLSAVDAGRKPLGDLVEIKTGKLDANAAKENGKYPFFTCSREIFAIDNYAFDTEAILLAGNNASADFNVKHYVGKFNAYQRTYVITIPDTNRLSYRYLYFQMLKSLKEFKNKAVGTNTKFLKLGMIKELQIELPDISKQMSIVGSLDRLTGQIDSLESIYQGKLNCFDQFKKSTLQKAFSGNM